VTNVLNQADRISGSGDPLSGEWSCCKRDDSIAVAEETTGAAAQHTAIPRDPPPLSHGDGAPSGQQSRMGVEPAPQASTGDARARTPTHNMSDAAKRRNTGMLSPIMDTAGRSDRPTGSVIAGVQVN